MAAANRRLRGNRDGLKLKKKSNRAEYVCTRIALVNASSGGLLLTNRPDGERLNRAGRTEGVVPGRGRLAQAHDGRLARLLHHRATATCRQRASASSHPNARRYSTARWIAGCLSLNFTRGRGGRIGWGDL